MRTILIVRTFLLWVTFAVIPAHSQTMNIDHLVTALTWLPTGDQLVIGRGDGSLTRVNVATGDAFEFPTHPAAAVMVLSASPDGSKISSGDNEGVVDIWDAMTGERLATFDPLAGRQPEVALRSPVADLAWSPDARWLAVSFADSNVVSVIDATTGIREYMYVLEFRDIAMSVAWLSGTQIVFESSEFLYIWNLFTDQVEVREVIFEGRAIFIGPVVINSERDQIVVVGRPTRSRHVLLFMTLDGTIQNQVELPEGLLYLSH